MSDKARPPWMQDLTTLATPALWYFLVLHSRPAVLTGTSTSYTKDETKTNPSTF